MIHNSLFIIPMQIAGIQKLTLVDFPGTVAATIFTRGCSFRCGFCHNPELVLPEKFNPLLSESQIFDFLESRYGKINGICITGGEPLFQPDCDKFISHIKALGFKVKLDTNGSFPERLEKIIKDGDVDYLAMDIKNSLVKYSQTVNPKSHSSLSLRVHPSESKSEIRNPKKLDVISSHSEPATGRIEEGEKSQHSENKLIKNIKQSIKLIMSSNIDYEFRTTVCHPLHEVADFKEMGEMINGAKRYFIQNYKQTKQVDENSIYKSFSDKELLEVKKIMAGFFGGVDIR